MKPQLPKRMTRRDFLKIGGLTLGASLTACGRQKVPSELYNVPTLGAEVPAYNTPDARPPASGPSDLIMTNGKVYTVDPNNNLAQAVAVKDGLIQAVGDDQTITAMAGDSTQRIDLGGRAVTPGLIDGHVHFRAIGLDYIYYYPFLPPEVKDIPSLQAALVDILKTKQPGEWVIGYYMYMTDKPTPTKEDLDPISPDNPVFIMHIGGHWAGTNSAALKLAGVTSKTKSPEGGIIEMGKDGEPTGILYNHRAMDVVRVNAPPITPEMIHESILTTQKLMAACGVTSFQDNNIRELEHMQAYQEMTKDGQLFLRNDLYLTLEWPADIAKLDKVDHFRNDVTRFAGYKFLLDGQGPTAYCHEKHNGSEWRMPTWEPEMYKSVVRTLHDTGLQICTHVIGDASADLALEAYEEAMNANPRSDPRHRLEHAVLTTPQTTQKIVDLGVPVSTEPAFLYLFGDGWKRLFGEERMDRIMVTREWVESGVHLTVNSDAPSTPFYHPGWALAGSMNRETIQGDFLDVDQALTFEEALRAHTIEGAYAAHEENVKGSLEPGKFADLAVWVDDPAGLEIEELAWVKEVYMTLVGGKIVHQQS